MGRAFDIGVSSALDVGFPAKSATAPFSFITGIYSRVKSLGISAFKPTNLGGGGSDTLNIVLQDSAKPGLYHQNTFDGEDDGSVKLKEGAALQTAIAIPFTQSAVDYRTPIGIVLWLSKVGIPANAGGDVPSFYVDVVADDGAGDPQGIPTYSASYRFATADISASGPTPILVGFQGGAYEVTNGGNFWIVIRPVYDADANNCIQVHYNTVAGTSGCKVNSGGWAAIANSDIWFQLFQLTFADVSNDVFDEGAFMPYEQDGYFTNPLDSAQIRNVDTRKVRDYLRLRYDISGGTWYPFIFALGGYPYELPLIGGELPFPLI